MRFVVAGTGRCGTGYVSQLLTQIGIPTGHEQVFTLDGFQDKGYFQGDASWLSVPFLSDFSELHVVHLIRNRQNTIDSFRRIGFYDPRVDHGRYREFVRTYAPEVDNPELHYDTWNAKIELYRDVVWRTEEIDKAAILSLAQAIDVEVDEVVVDRILAELPTNINTR